jgi:hypothetical protein
MKPMANQPKNTKAPATPKKKAEKKSEAAPAAHAAHSPLINPSHSAAAAAALVGRKVTPTGNLSGPQTESTSFRNLKDSMTKPHSQTIGNVLDKIAPSGQKRSAVPFAGSKQQGHNQTFGADVSRRNIPRRTNG